MWDEDAYLRAAFAPSHSQPILTRRKPKDKIEEEEEKEKETEKVKAVSSRVDLSPASKAKKAHQVKTEKELTQDKRKRRYSTSAIDTSKIQKAEKEVLEEKEKPKKLNKAEQSLFGSDSERMTKSEKTKEFNSLFPQKEEVTFTASDGLTLKGALIKPRDGEESEFTYLFLSGAKGTYEEYASDLAIQLVERHKHQLFVFNYRGYGDNYDAGHPSVEGLQADGEGALDYLINVLNIPPEKIVVYGFSLGGAIAAELATKHPVSVYLDRIFTKISVAAKETATWGTKTIAKIVSNTIAKRFNPIKSLKKTKAIEIKVFLGDEERGKKDKHVNKFNKTLETLNKKRKKAGKPPIPSKVHSFDNFPHVTNLPSDLPKEFKAAINKKE